MPQHFQYPDRTEVWVPLQARYAGYAEDWWKRRDMRIHSVLTRLKPGISAKQEQSDLQTVVNALANQFPVTNDGVQIRLSPLRELETGKLRPYLLLLLGAVLMVLLICCVNVANLLLARSVSREREMAVRTALGGAKAHRAATAWRGNRARAAWRSTGRRIHVRGCRRVDGVDPGTAAAVDAF